MVRHRIQGVLLATLLFVSVAANAGFSANLALTSDYVSDGISQSDEDAALQGSVDWYHDNGLYLGAWASSVDFGKDDNGDDFSKWEFSLYGGYYWAVSETVAIDMGVERNFYDDLCDCDYHEYYLGMVFNDNTSVTAWFTDDYSNGGTDAFRVKLKHDFPLTESLALGVEYTYTDADEVFTYNHYRLGLAYTRGAWTFDVSYHDTDLEQDEDPDGLGDSRVAATFSYRFGE